jgi:hypothetical protein
VAGLPGDTLTVVGSSLPANQTRAVFWDSSANVLGQANVDGEGSFRLSITVPDGDAGDHQVCVADPNACATFNLQAATSPSPSPSETPSPGPEESPTPEPAAVATPPSRGGSSGLPLLLTPPFVLFPILLLVALAGGVYLLWHRPDGEASLVAAMVSHRSPLPGAQQAKPSPAQPDPERPTRPRRRGGSEGPPDLPIPGD